MKELNVVFITNRKPSLASGGEVRNLYLLNSLKKSFSVKVIIPDFSKISFLDKNGDVTFLNRILFTLLGKIPYIEKLRNATFTSQEIKEIQNADIVQVQEMEAYFTIEKYFKKIKGKKILDTHNIDYVRFVSETESKGTIEKYMGRLFGFLLKHIEIDVVRKFDKILVCSIPEKEYFSRYIPQQNVEIVPNGAIIKEVNENITIKENTILFMGLLGYTPNAEGLQYYLHQIHPLVVKKVPNAKLIILGKDAPEWLIQKANSDKHTIFKGFVKDVTPYIARAKVCICPLLSGSGTRLKILEYMAMGKPVVSTSIGAEGLQVKDKKNILITDHTRQFARDIVKLLTNKDYAKRIGKEARKTVNKHYAWKAIGENLIKVYAKFIYE